MEKHYSYYMKRRLEIKLAQYSLQIRKLFRKGLLTEQEILEFNKEQEHVLAGIAKSRKLSQRLFQRINDK